MGESSLDIYVVSVIFGQKEKIEKEGERDKGERKINKYKGT